MSNLSIHIHENPKICLCFSDFHSCDDCVFLIKADVLILMLKPNHREKQFHNTLKFIFECMSTKKYRQVNLHCFYRTAIKIPFQSKIIRPTSYMDSSVSHMITLYARHVLARFYIPLQLKQFLIVNFAL